MTKKIILSLILIGCLFVAVACGNNGTEVAEDEISVDVTNNTEEIIVSFAVFYGDNLDEWGEELLGDEVIEPGETYTFLLPEGQYTALFFTFENYIINAARNFDESISIQIGGDDKVPVLFRNLTEGDIAFLSILESGSIDFEEDPLGEDVAEKIIDADMLGAEVLPAGLSRFIFIRPGVYDLIGLDYELEVVFGQSEIEIEQGSTITIGQ